MTVNEIDVEYHQSQVDQFDRRKAVHLTYLQASLRCATLSVRDEVANINFTKAAFRVKVKAKIQVISDSACICLRGWALGGSR